MRHRARRNLRLVGVLVTCASVVALGGSASAFDSWYMTGFYRSGYPTTQECGRVINGAYGSTWFTQNIAYVDWGGTCNVQHTLASCWLKARSIGSANGVATNFGTQTCNSSSSAIAQGNVVVGATDTGLTSQMWFYDVNTGSFRYYSATGP